MLWVFSARRSAFPTYFLTNGSHFTHIDLYVYMITNASSSGLPSMSSARRCDALLGEGCVLGDKKLRLPTTFVTFCVSPGARRWPGKVEVMASFLSDGLCFG